MCGGSGPPYPFADHTLPLLSAVVIVMVDTQPTLVSNVIIYHTLIPFVGFVEKNYNTL